VTIFVTGHSADLIRVEDFSPVACTQSAAAGVRP